MNNFIVTSQDDDIIGSSSTRAAPARGRRATQKMNSGMENDVLPPTSTLPPVSDADSGSVDPSNTDRPKRRRQMWDVANNAEAATDNRLVNDDSDSEENVIPVIPVLEEINEEEVMQSVAVPPTVLREILSYRELDSDLMRQSAFSMLDNEIDLKVLTKSLVREKDLIEPDEPWEMNQLFAEIQSMVSRVNDSAESSDEKSKEMLI